MSDTTYRLLGEEEKLEPTGGVHVKGKGIMDTYVWPSSCAAAAGGLVDASAQGTLHLEPCPEGGLWPSTWPRSSLTHMYSSTLTSVQPTPSGRLRQLLLQQMEHDGLERASVVLSSLIPSMPNAFASPAQGPASASDGVPGLVL